MTNSPGQRDAKLEQLGYPLGEVPKPAASYLPVVISGGLAYLSGAVPFERGNELAFQGSVPSQVSLAEATRAAALCAANSLRVLAGELGSLDRIERVLRLAGYVNSDADFTEQHLVMNGASELLVQVLGDAGKHARSAVGVAQLPLGATVEVDMIVKLTD
jgi:enamine deaminase RidA (YjgF/YER057c/UK114 family)